MYLFIYNLTVTIQRVLSSLGVWFQLSLKYKHRLSRVFVWINEKDIWFLCNHAVTLWEPSLGFSCVTVHCACVCTCQTCEQVLRDHDPSQFRQVLVSWQSGQTSVWFYQDIWTGGTGTEFFPSNLWREIFSLNLLLGFVERTLTTGEEQ